MNRLAKKLSDWYQAGRILYPWRQTSDPYRIWVSEILLQQTRISVAVPFFEKIVDRYPSFQDLAAADPAEFLASWSGIGYYRRAGNMLACAKAVVEEYGGVLPRDLKALLKLPGIGPYTAGAIRTLCFGELTPAIDGNIGRVLARITGCSIPVADREFARRIGVAFMTYGAGAPAGDYFQSLMELGERVCLPRPDCPRCPVRTSCRARKDGTVETIPVRSAGKRKRPVYWYFLLMRRRGAYFFVRNPQRDFLKSAWLFPDLLSDRPLSAREIRRRFLKQWNIKIWRMDESGAIRHAVTFRRITAYILTVRKYEVVSNDGLWLAPGDLRSLHTSSVAHKILKKCTPQP